MLHLINFNDMESGSGWVAVNDGVMGGRSEGAPVLVDGVLQFHGSLSLANNGGFSSVRTMGQSFDFSGITAVVLRVRGDGRRYQLRLATEACYRGIAVSYGSEFATVAEQWIEARVPLDSLIPTVRGTRLDGPPFDAAHVREIGLLIADKREGPFALDVAWIGLEQCSASMRN
jgi:NADH dehydrogenase [ubiquinone] 1 alpha subcomplex assembly factor 1